MNITDLWSLTQDDEVCWCRMVSQKTPSEWCAAQLLRWLWGSNHWVEFIRELSLVSILWCATSSQAIAHSACEHSLVTFCRRASPAFWPDITLALLTVIWKPINQPPLHYVSRASILYNSIVHFMLIVIIYRNSQYDSGVHGSSTNVHVLVDVVAYLLESGPIHFTKSSKFLS